LLAFAVSAELGDLPGRQRDIAPTVSRLGSFEPKAAALGLFERLFDSGAGNIQIDILPAQRRDFTPSAPCPEKERHNRSQSATIQVFEDGGDLILFQNGDLRIDKLRRSNSGSDVLRYHTPSRGMPKRAVQHAVNVAHGSSGEGALIASA
jgi:hypothetical protein